MRGVDGINEGTLKHQLCSPCSTIRGWQRGWQYKYIQQYLATNTIQLCCYVIVFFLSRFLSCCSVFVAVFSLFFFIFTFLCNLLPTLKFAPGILSRRNCLYSSLWVPSLRYFSSVLIPCVIESWTVLTRLPVVNSTNTFNSFTSSSELSLEHVLCEELKSLSHSEWKLSSLGSSIIDCSCLILHVELSRYKSSPRIKLVTSLTNSCSFKRKQLKKYIWNTCSISYRFTLWLANGTNNYFFNLDCQWIY